MTREYDAAFLIADLAGYTALTEVHGHMAAADVVGFFVEMVKKAMQPGVSLEHYVGDEVLLKSGEADPLLQSAAELMKASDTALNFPCLHTGLHFGRILEQEGRYFGSTINLTSRIASFSGGGQILCSGAFIGALARPADWNFRSLGPVQFKNYSEAVEVFELEPVVSQCARVFDPVCHMQVDPGAAPARLPYGDNTYYFCSFECARRFAEQPVRYALV